MKMQSFSKRLTEYLPLFPQPYPYLTESWNDFTTPDPLIYQSPRNKNSSLDDDIRTAISNIDLTITRPILKPDWISLPLFSDFLGNLFAYQAQEKGLQWELEFPPESVELWVDPIQFARVLRSLIKQAIKLTKKFQIKLSCKLLGGPAPAEGVEFHISDTDSSDQNKTALHSAKARSTIKKNNPGLTTVEKIVELMGGSLKIERVPSKGTTITAHLPHVAYINRHK